MLAVLPALMVLSACAGVNAQAKANVMIEDTLAHEEIFGDFGTAIDLRVRREDNVEPQRDAADPYLQPKIGVQYRSYTENNNNYLAVRFVAAIAALNVKAVWTRGASDGLNVNENYLKPVGTQVVEKAYTSINSRGVPVPALGDGYNYYVVYTMQKIPLDQADSYLAAYLTISNLEENEYHAPVKSQIVVSQIKSDGIAFSANHTENGYFIHVTADGSTTKNVYYGANDNDNNSIFESVTFAAGDKFGLFKFNSTGFAFLGQNKYMNNSAPKYIKSSDVNLYGEMHVAGSYEFFVSKNDGTKDYVYAEPTNISTTFIFTPNANWKSAGILEMYAYNSKGQNQWYDLGSPDEQGKCTLNVTGWKYSSVIFIRRNPDKPTHNFDSAWDKSSDFAIDLSKRNFVMYDGTWNGDMGQWQ